ncbi:MAG TPA: hypothetical protein DCF82_05700, partial [Marinobacter hydrocarbonoclasticus]|nr:hypothetical protein [Marinobacter nauticus]
WLLTWIVEGVAGAKQQLIFKNEEKSLVDIRGEAWIRLAQDCTVNSIPVAGYPPVFPALIPIIGPFK